MMVSSRIPRRTAFAATAAFAFLSRLPSSADALMSNNEGDPQDLYQDVCIKAQGRTSGPSGKCRIEVDIPTECVAQPLEPEGMTDPAAASTSVGRKANVGNGLAGNRGNGGGGGRGPQKKASKEDASVAAMMTAGGVSYCPVVVFLDAGSSTKSAPTPAETQSGLVHEAGWIGVYPRPEPQGWNVGTPALDPPTGGNECTWAEYGCESDPDEGAFLASVLGRLRTDGAMGNVYLSGRPGRKGGADLVHRIGSSIANDEARDHAMLTNVRGIVSVGRQLLQMPIRSGPGHFNSNYPSPSRTGSADNRISVLSIMGTADGAVPYDGGYSSAVFGLEKDTEEAEELMLSSGDDFMLLPAMASMASYAKHDGCNPLDESTYTPTKLDVAVGGKNSDKKEALVYDWAHCKDGAVLRHVAVQGATNEDVLSATAVGKNAALMEFEWIKEFIYEVEGGVAERPTGKPEDGDDMMMGGEEEASGAEGTEEGTGNKGGNGNKGGKGNGKKKGLEKMIADQERYDAEDAAAAAASDFECKDNPNWRVSGGKGGDKKGGGLRKDCNFVSKNTKEWCALVNDEDKDAYTECPVTCNSCMAAEMNYLNSQGGTNEAEGATESS